MSCCVHCGRDRDSHGPNLKCVGSASELSRHFATMDLPEGKTCNNCHFVKHCCALYGKHPEDKTCDFFPVRFIERPL